MCGIAGVFTINKNIDHADCSKQMIQHLHHRGPDFLATQSVSEYCSLSHARLKIIDLTDNANQPMHCYQQRFVIVFNGEIYNFKQLKLELQRVSYQSKNISYPFQTQSDTEVILAAYHRWGEECVKYLDGMFAFAIYDKQTNELFLARDRQGKKPLYFLHNKDVFIFSSEISPIIQSPFSKRKLDYTQLYDYLQYQTSFSPHTLIEDIQLLEPAHTLKVKVNGNNQLNIEKKQYWQPIDKILQSTDISYEEAVKHTRQLLFSAVEKRLISDVPLGAFLSGGIDSSAIVGIMRHYFSSKVNTFHVTTDEYKFSEQQYAQTLSDIYQTNHHNIVLKEKDILALVPEALEKMDYPTGDGINTYIVSKSTKNAGITVALSGLGGDELFAGYPQFKVLSQLHKWDIVDFPGIRKLLAELLPNQLFHSAYRLKILMQSESLSVDKLFPYYRQVFHQKKIPLKTKNHQSFLNLNREYKYLLNEKHLLSFISLLEMQNYMQHVLLRDTDQMSMASALEVRAPFLDTALISFALSLPDEYKYPTTPKKLLTDAISDLLPKDIIHRKKMGFVLPFEKWMRKELKGFCEEKIKSFAEREFTDKKILLEEWKKYISGKHKRWWMFWHIIVLENWLEKLNINDK